MTLCALLARLPFINLSTVTYLQNHEHTMPSIQLIDNAIISYPQLICFPPLFSFQSSMDYLIGVKSQPFDPIQNTSSYRLSKEGNIAFCLMG